MTITDRTAIDKDKSDKNKSSLSVMKGKSSISLTMSAENNRDQSPMQCLFCQKLKKELHALRKKNISIRDDRNKLKKSNQELKQKLENAKA